MPISAVQFVGGRLCSRCGYCKHNSGFSDGMRAYRLTADDYQDLIDRGWRRSGTYCYKPNNSKTCCPCYTIRCDTTEFKLSRSHKKILKRMNKFLRDGIKDDEDIDEAREESQIHDIGEDPKIPVPENLKQNLNNLNIKKFKIDSDYEEVKPVAEKTNSRESDTAKANTEIDIKADDSAKSIENISDNKPAKKKAKQFRIERKKAKLAAKGFSVEDLKPNPPKNPEKSLNDYINETNTNNVSLRHKLRIVNISSTNKGEIIDQEFDLYYKYQTIIHNDSPDRIKVVEVNSDEFLATLSFEFELYKKYQNIIHNDLVYSTSEFTNFLQDSPVELQTFDNGPLNGYGSFHQQYWLDDKLIAVGVIDILPKCLSSVYFFYDPDYRFLSLGTYGSLREIDFTLQISKTLPEFKFYYMGFYIHSCPKMRYKGKLTGSYLLCPEKYTWHLLSDDIRRKLDENKYSILNTNPNENDANEFEQRHLDFCQILFMKSGETTCTPYKTYKRIKKTNIDDELIHFGKLVGKICSGRIMYFIE